MIADTTERGDASDLKFLSLIYNQRRNEAATWFHCHGWQVERTELLDPLNANERPTPPMPTAAQLQASLRYASTMIQDIFQRWIVIALFVMTAAECVFAITTGRRTWKLVIGRLLQFVMSVAMPIMAWPWGVALPTIGPLVFFLLAAVWFVAVGFTDDDHRVVNGYHALKMLAMSWMYAVMNGNLLPGQGNGSPAWIDAINSIWAIGFAIAALWWLYWYVAQRKSEPTKRWHRFLGTAGQAMMAAGMAITCAVMP